MTTILFHYLHRDEGNWKDYLDAVIDNPEGLPLDIIETRIQESLISMAFFEPRKAGLRASEHAEPGDWHEFDYIEEAKGDSRKPAMTVQELIERLASSCAAPKAELHRQSRASLSTDQLATRCLDFVQTVLRSVKTILDVCKGEKTVMVFNDGDWELLAETLDLDAHSANFDLELRRDILKALDRAAEVDVSPLRDIRRQGRLIKSLLRRVKRAA